MKGVNRFVGVLTAIIFALVIAGSHLAWNMRTATYLEQVAGRAGTNQAIATALPEYAANKLPNPEETKKVFMTNVSATSAGIALDSLYTSISAAYMGKTDVVELDLQPIVRPVQAAGYEIPPGTVFAAETIKVGGIAPVLRTTQRVFIPSIILLLVLLALVALLGFKRNSLRAIRSVLLIAALILAGLYVATLGLPMLISSLVTSSSLDAGMRDILLAFTNAMIADVGRYYIAWIVLLLLVSLVLTIVVGFTGRRKRPSRHNRKQLPAPELTSKEL